MTPLSHLKNKRPSLITPPIQMTCEVKHDNSLPEVVAELTLAETGEMLGRDLVEIISQPTTNKTELVITELLPGQI